LQIPALFLQNYPGLFSHGFTREEAEAAAGPPEQLRDWFIPGLHDATLLQVNALGPDGLVERLNRLGLPEDRRQPILNLETSHRFNVQEVRELLTDLHPAMPKLFAVVEGSEMQTIRLTSVGVALGCANLRRVTKEPIDLSVWIPS